LGGEPEMPRNSEMNCPNSIQFGSVVQFLHRAMELSDGNANNGTDREPWPDVHDWLP